MHYRQGSPYRGYTSELDNFLRTLHTQVCQTASADANTKEIERKKYEEHLYPMRDSATVPRVRIKRWQDEKETPRSGQS
ncbi:MAG: hypothetical protein RLZ35_569 [Pseudomonadota bacterium]|jgi:hypothetical protein